MARRVGQVGASFLAQGEDRAADEIDRQRQRTHRCHMLGCNVDVPPAMLMCRRHWFMCPKPLRQEVWRLYQKGQEQSKTPTAEYLAAARAAIAAVVELERQKIAAAPMLDL